MKKVSKGFKSMLNGLAYQDVGEFLPRREKVKTLADNAVINDEPTVVVRRAQAPGKHIALVSDGSAMGAAFEYAIDACSRQNAQLDLLIYGEMNSHEMAELKQQAQSAGIECGARQLGDNAVAALLDYTNKQPSLIYLVAKSSDIIVRELTEKCMPMSGTRIHVPLVLVDGAAATKQPAACA